MNQTAVQKGLPTTYPYWCEEKIRMSKFLFKSLLVGPAVVGTALIMSSAAIAAEARSEVAPVAPAAPLVLAQAAPASLDQVNQYSREGRSVNVMGQVTSVSQLSDVKPTDWAFQALQSLVERYGCIAGYPDKSYRGNRAMTRYEFAAGLNSCMDRVNELIGAATADLVKKEDLETLKKLQEEFAAELATLRGRVDALEARTATLEKQQFSTTTKLSGEVIFAVSDEVGQPVDNNVVLQDRVRLTLNTSFTGKDLLITRLAAGNAGTFDISGNGIFNNGTAGEGFQTFNYGNTGGNALVADWVAYYFPLGEKVKVYLAAVAGLHYDYVPTNSGPQESYDGGSGALSMFGQRNPIYSIGGGSGLAVSFDFTKAISLSVGYLANNGAGSTAANNPSSGNGLFDGSYSALAQLTFKPSDAFSVGLTYVNAFRNNGSTIFDGGGSNVGTSVGTLHSNLSGSGQLGLGDTSAEVNAFGISAAFRFSSALTVNGFFTYVDAGYNGAFSGSADIFTYGIGISLPDFGKKGNLLGFVVGAEPYVSNPGSITGLANTNLSTSDVPIHVEGFYKYKLSDNISVTPGVIWVINPGQNNDNDDVIIGTIRTTFTF
jgi:Carbohydrate-selective porin, OprB family/S-layer homology domain